MDILNIRHELEEIRVHRSTDMGCTCRKLTVYLPPTDGTGGKKAAHRRMNVLKLKDELKKRGLLNNNNNMMLSRHEMEVLLHDAVELESCCAMSDDCVCIRNGINCQADVCSCWHVSHQTKEQHHHKKNHKNTATANTTTTDNDDDEKQGGVMLSVERIQERCGNKYGMYVVNVDEISAFRKEMLCQFIGTND
jgi:hypothetical protein